MFFFFPLYSVFPNDSVADYFFVRNDMFMILRILSAAVVTESLRVQLWY